MNLESVLVPSLGAAHDVGVIEILVQLGQRIEREQPMVVLETDKASMEVPSPRAGIVESIEVKVGDKVSEGFCILKLAAEASASDGPRVAPTPTPSVPSQKSEPSTPSIPYATPAVRRFAREQGVELAKVNGTAKGGRILREDVENTLRQRTRTAVDEAPARDVLPLTQVQRLSARNLRDSWTSIPHVTQFDEADITELDAFRKSLREESNEPRFTLVTFIVKALASALVAMPRFNASLDERGENLRRHAHVHVGVAVDTPQGLVVPVLHNVDRKGLRQIAEELSELSERARSRRLRIEDVQGASMTVSSLGGIGGTAFTPIINPPELAILGVSKAALKPVYRAGGLEPRLICPLSLSYDHRAIDGAQAAAFTSYLGTVLGDLRRLLL